MKENAESPEIEEYLRRLSERLRGLRARRGMTRKDLAKHSGISERYLAQLENSEANPSLIFLWRIVQAMDISLIDLLAEHRSSSHPALADFIQNLTPDEQATAYSVLLHHFSGQRSNFHGVALIGLRGAGKSTLGRKLSTEFGVPFIRLGDVIESLSGMELSELFSLGGQKAYRRLERQAVDHVVTHYSGAIVEAGGSLVSELETFNMLRSAFYTVWLRTSPEDHMKRVIQQGDMRPIQGSEEAMEDLRRILAEREPYYRTANHVIDTGGRTIDSCVEELASVCAPYLREVAKEPR